MNKKERLKMWIAVSVTCLAVFICWIVYLNYYNQYRTNSADGDKGGYTLLDFKNKFLEIKKNITNVAADNQEKENIKIEPGKIELTDDEVNELKELLESRGLGLDVNSASTATSAMQ